MIDVDNKLDIAPNTLALDFVMGLPDDTRICLRDSWGDPVIESRNTNGAIGYLKLFHPKILVDRVYKNAVRYEVYLGEALI